MRVWFLGVSLMLAFASGGCKVSTIYMSVTGHDGRYIVQLKLPFYAQSVPRVEYVELYRDPQKPESLICRLKTADGEARPLSRWTYGDTPSGFALERCDPLERGTSYSIHAGNVGGLGARRFAITAEGQVDNLGREWW
jgi:hypothetical protein